LIFFETFSSQIGNSIFLRTDIFSSSSSGLILDQKYSRDPQTYKTGPIIYKNGLYVPSEGISQGLTYLNDLGKN
jgi:hypothetical protein